MRVFLALTAAVFFIAVFPTAAQEQGKDGATATMNVFSGRPNPAWTLSKEQTMEMMRRYRGLQLLRGTRDLKKEEQLGYNGVIVTARLQGDLYRFDVRHGIVRANTPDGFKIYSDADRLFEAWLVKTSQGRVPGDVFKAAVYDVIKDRYQR